MKEYVLLTREGCLEFDTPQGVVRVIYLGRRTSNRAKLGIEADPERITIQRPGRKNDGEDEV